VDRIQDNGKGCAVLRVRDQGIGIPEQDQAHIFERFRRGANVAAIVGTGIGLAGACLIVEQHGGTLSVASREGEGSTFTVRLPLVPD
jgi:signal transduction histidine kinase